MAFASSYSTSHIISKKASKFAKSFKHKSLGIFSSGVNQQKHQSNEKFYVEKKVHPKPECMSFEIEDLFEAISNLKLAYVDLQNAHLFYNPFKIKFVDEYIVLQLEKLSKMECAFKKLMKIKQDSCQFGHINLQLLDKLEYEIKARETRIAFLKKEVQDLSLSNAKMIHRLTSSNKGSDFSVNVFEETYGRVSKAIHDFTKVMVMLMRASNWDLDCAAQNIEKSTAYSKGSHKKYAFHAFVARRMFVDFYSSHSNNNESLHQDMRFQDPIKALIEDPNSPFGEFCISKYMLVVHPKLEASFFGNLDHRNMIRRGMHPRTGFYQGFVKMAQWVWILREIARFGPKMGIFGVEGGARFCGRYMERVTSEFGSWDELIVEFMVMPGFRFGNDIVKCKVYTSKRRV